MVINYLLKVLCTILVITHIVAFIPVCSYDVIQAADNVSLLRVLVKGSCLLVPGRSDL